MTTLTPTIAIDTRTGAAHISSLGSIALTEYKPVAGPSTSFDAAADALLHWRWGRAIMPEATSVEGDGAAGFFLPHEVVREDARLLEAGQNVWRLTVMRYPHATAGTGAGSNSPVSRNFHNTATHIGIDSLLFNTTTTPVEDAQMETTLQRKNGTALSSSNVTHLVTRADLGMSDGGLVYFFTEIISEDPDVGNSPNARTTVWAVNPDGTEKYPATQFTHFTATPSDNYPLWGAADMPSDTAIQIYGRAYGNGRFGTQGEIRAIVYGTRTGTLLDDAADVKSAVETMLRGSALPAPLVAAAGVEHAWTSQPDRTFLTDVVGSANLTALGSGTAVAAGSAAMTGLADVWRGITVASQGASSEDMATQVEADLAAGKGVVFLIALNRASAQTSTKSIVEIGSAAADVLCRIRQTATNTLTLAIGEGSNAVNLILGDIATLWPSQTGTLLLCGQFTNNSADHDGETNKQQVIGDVLNLSTLVRTREVLYDDGDASDAAMRLTTTKPMCVGVTDTGASPFVGTIGLAYRTIEPGDSGVVLWDQTRALDELWELFVDGQVQAPATGSGRSPSRAGKLLALGLLGGRAA